MIAVAPLALPPGLLLVAAAAAAATGMWLLLPRGRDLRVSQVAGAALGIASVPGFWLAARSAGNSVDLDAGVPLALAAALLAGGTWLLLPRSRGFLWRVVAFLVGLAAVVALGFLAWSARGLGPDQGVFVIVSLVAVVSAAATIASRSPVYAAIWFALALAGVAGVLLVLGAQFLGVATIVVYAGAILVMFLFVLMLAQPTGMAPYDRVSNEPLFSAVAGTVLLGLLTLSIGRLSAQAPECCRMPSKAAALNAPRADEAGSGTAVTDAKAPAARAVDPLAADQVARLGGELFGRHLLAVEVAGVLLLVALVGAIAVVARAGDHSGELAGRGAR